VTTHCGLWFPFSLISIGRGPSILAGIQHQSVDVYHWINEREFVELFAVARASPGPGSMLVTLLGWKVAGWTGAVIATLALFIPSSLLCYGVAKVWGHYRGRDWHTALENGFAPVGAGLILAGVFAIFRVAGAGMLSWAIAGVAALIFGYRPKLNPFLFCWQGRSPLRPFTREFFNPDADAPPARLFAEPHDYAGKWANCRREHALPAGESSEIEAMNCKDYTTCQIIICCSAALQAFRHLPQ
jgi:chromate transporter